MSYYTLLNTIASPTDPVKQVGMQSSQNVSDISNNALSVVSLFTQSDLLVKLVIILLVLISIFSWSVILQKLWLIRRIKKKMGHFENALLKEEYMDDLLEEANNVDNNHPILSIVRAVLNEWKLRERNSLEKIKIIMEATLQKEMISIKSGVDILGTISSTSPFIGLLGTVWGIMTSFRAISSMQSTGLSVVAPGITEALLATAIGLIVAIPASMLYNYLSSEINEINERSENFCLNLLSVMMKTD